MKEMRRGKKEARIEVCDGSVLKCYLRLVDETNLAYVTLRQAL